MINVYHKTATIKAEQFDGRQKYIFGHKVMSEDSLVDALTHDPVYYSILINEGYPEEEPDEVIFEIGDWIMLEKEYFEVIDNETFKKLYDALPVIPQFIADWIEECKRNNQAIGAAMDQQSVPTSVRNYFRSHITTAQWIEVQNIFARAWLDGYQLEAQHD